MALVLTRRLNEKTVITCPDGTRIEVSVNQIDSDRVRLGFEADKSVAIFREEIIGKARRESVPVSKRISEAVSALREGQP